MSTPAWYTLWKRERHFRRIRWRRARVRAGLL